MEGTVYKAGEYAPKLIFKGCGVGTALARDARPRKRRATWEYIAAVE